MKHILTLSLLFTAAATAQTTVTTPGGGTTTTTPSPGTSRAPSTPTDPNSQRRSTETNMPIFITGKVTVSDGSPVPHGVVIRSICLNTQRTVAYVDSKGYFNFEWGKANSAMLPDASDGYDPSVRQGGSGPFGNQRGVDVFSDTRSSGGGINSTMSLMGCELRAEANGFRSDVLSLDSHRAFDNPDVGTLVLYRTAGVEGTSVSATAMNAPKEARKAYEKGLQALKRGKPADALPELQKATSAYPQYANAWLDLGRAQLQLKEPDAASESFVKAVEADGKLVGGHAELGMMEVRKSNWADAAKYLDAALKLDPISFPQLWYPDAVAHYNLKNLEAAEKNVRSALQHDPQHKNPQASHLLGVILALRNDLPGAVSALQTYLKQAPVAPDVQQVQLQLAEIQSAQERR